MRLGMVDGIGRVSHCDQWRCRFQCLFSVMMIVAGFTERGLCDDGKEWIEKTTAVLRRIERDTRANFEQIRTWRGRFRYQSYNLYEGANAFSVTKQLSEEQQFIAPLTRVTSGSHDFALDVPGSSFFSQSSQDNLPQFRKLSTGEVLAIPQPPYNFTEIVTPERTIIVDGLHRKVQINGFSASDAAIQGWPVALIIPTKSTEIRGWGGDFEPRKVFGFNVPIWEEMGGMAAAIEKVPAEYLKETMAGISVSEVPNGEHVDLVYEKRPKGRRVKIVFGGAVGHCPTSYAVYRPVDSSSSESGKEYLNELQTWDYFKESEVFLPKRVSRKTTKSDGTLIDEYTLMLESSEFNKDLGPDAFTYKWLGLKDGDRLFDEIAQKLYKVSGKKLVEIP